MWRRAWFIVVRRYVFTLRRADAIISLTLFVAGITSSSLNRVHTSDMLPLAADDRLLKYSLMSNRVGLVLPSSRKDVLNRGKMPGHETHRSEANATSRTTGTKTNNSQFYFFQTDALET